jgi:hypothetical protein
LPDRLTAAERLRLNSIGFIVLNRASASAELIGYVERVLPVALIAEETADPYPVRPLSRPPGD